VGCASEGRWPSDTISRKSAGNFKKEEGSSWRTGGGARTRGNRLRRVLVSGHKKINGGREMRSEVRSPPNLANQKTMRRNDSYYARGVGETESEGGGGKMKTLIGSWPKRLTQGPR